MSDAPEPWRLTDDEIASLSTWDDGSYHCPCRYRCMCDDSEKVHLFDAAGSIKEAAWRDAQVAALEDAADALDALPKTEQDNGWGEGYDEADRSTAKWLRARAAELRGDHD